MSEIERAKERSRAPAKDSREPWPQWERGVSGTKWYASSPVVSVELDESTGIGRAGVASAGSAEQHAAVAICGKLFQLPMCEVSTHQLSSRACGRPASLYFQPTSGDQLRRLDGAFAVVRHFGGLLLRRVGVGGRRPQSTAAAHSFAQQAAAHGGAACRVVEGQVLVVCRPGIDACGALRLQGDGWSGRLGWQQDTTGQIRTGRLRGNPVVGRSGARVHAGGHTVGTCAPPECSNWGTGCLSRLTHGRRPHTPARSSNIFRS
jgi:hypothetical protein